MYILTLSLPLCSCLTPQSAASNVFPSHCYLNKCCCPSSAVTLPPSSPAVPPCLTLYASTGSSAPSRLPSRHDTLWVPFTLRSTTNSSSLGTPKYHNPWHVKLYILWICHLNVLYDNVISGDNICKSMLNKAPDALAWRKLRVIFQPAQESV